MTQMGKLLPRQSDYLSRIQSHHALVLTLRNGGAPEVETQVDAQARWQDLIWDREKQSLMVGLANLMLIPARAKPERSQRPEIQRALFG